MNKNFLLSGFIVLGLSIFLKSENNLKTEDQFLSRVRQLTFEGRRSGEGYFSADGKNIIFQSEREPENPFYQIYTMSLETGDVFRVSPGSGKTTCAFFHPDSKQVLFASSHVDPDAINDFLKKNLKKEFDPNKIIDLFSN